MCLVCTECVLYNACRRIDGKLTVIVSEDDRKPM